MLLDKLKLAGGWIGAYAHDLDRPPLEFREFVPESLALYRSAAGIRLGEEPHYQAKAKKVDEG